MIEDWLNLLNEKEYDETRLIDFLKTMDMPTRDALIAVAVDSADRTPEQVRAICTSKADRPIRDAMRHAVSCPRVIPPAGAKALNRVAQEANTADALALVAYVDWWHGWNKWACERICDAYELKPCHSLTIMLACLYDRGVRPDTLLSD